MLLASRRARIARPIGAFRLKGATYVLALRGGMRPARPPRAQEEGEPMGFSSFCLWQAGEHAVRWSQPVGARIARPIGAFRLKGQRMCPRFTGKCGLRGRLAHKRRGNQNGSPCLLRITTPSFRARCARRSKSLFCCAARPPQRVSRTGATPEQQARIARTRQRPVGWYPSFLLLMADGRQGGRSHLPLRAKRALICGSKCRKSFFFSLGGLLRAKKEKG